MRVKMARSTDFRNKLAVDQGRDIPWTMGVSLDPSSLPDDLRAAAVTDGYYPSSISFVQYTDAGLRLRPDFPPGSKNCSRIYCDVADPSIEDAIAAIRVAINEAQRQWQERV